MSEAVMRKRHSANEAPRVAAAVLCLGACYFYFLLFGEFALVELARVVAAPSALRWVLAILALGGIAGSLAAAARFHPDRLSDSVVFGFVGATTAAAAASLARNAAIMSLAAGLTGLSLGWLTVTLVAGLRPILGERRTGLWTGLGTGIAYAGCNLPAVFAAGPRIQTMISAAVAFAGAAGARGLRSTPSPQPRFPDLRRSLVIGWMVALLALVWLDSAAFYAIQHSAGLKEAAWTGARVLWGNAAMHLLAAILAGWLLDRRRPAAVLGGAILALGGACEMLLEGKAGAQWAYTAGVSLYSVALVWYPLRSGRPWLGAAIFIIAGWLGSALGIGMVQDLAGIPRWFPWLAFIVVVSALIWRHLELRRTLAVAIVACAIVVPRNVRAGTDESAITRGREVYLAEGCIHCHSQYVRPDMASEVLWWGPPTALSDIQAEHPPLPGNRRQGPDLGAVGARRTADWQRVHLTAPRIVSGGSRMPSYSHLFQAGDKRGPDLVAYLESLGAENADEHYAATTNWRPAPAATPSPGRGPALFAQLCAGCHGPGGKGDGVLAPQLALPPVNLTAKPWPHIDARDPAAVARTIKFGLRGSAMAGHEYLADADIVALADYVRRLQSGSKP